jgi:hypothetical protein
MPGLDTIKHVGEDGSTYFFTSLRHKPHGASQPLSIQQRYRPSQDLTGLYGRQMHFHRIVRLNAREYVEGIAGQRSVSLG